MHALKLTPSLNTIVQRTLNVMAVERDTALQALLGEAIDLWLLKQSKQTGLACAAR
jgi:hypothetical protein